jgi:hypothetical protein
MARATVSPPTPESKIPIGASFMTPQPTRVEAAARITALTKLSA